MPSKKRPIWVRLIILFLVLIALGFFAFKAYTNYLKSPLNNDSKVKVFVIALGESIQKVSDRLQAEGIIRSSWVFREALKESGKDEKVETGDYKLSSSMSVDEIVKTLTEGSIDKWVTIIEGWRVEQVARQLNEQLGIDKNEFLKNATEGYMFPDTYLFNPDVTPADVASILKNTFNRKYSDDLQSQIKSKGLTAEQGVILASIVEREGRSDKVRTEVAGVLLKRFKMGMKLDADATVQYAKDTQSLGSGKLEKFWQPVSVQDYSKVISPYNTYLNNGLPPGPICNPSLASLNAVASANPNTPYLYYYHDSAGNSYYARTLDEHNENVANHK